MPIGDIRIIGRIGLVAGGIFLMMLTLMYVEMKTLGRIKDSLEEIVAVNNEKLILAQDMRFLARNSAVVLRNVLLVSDADARTAELARLAEDERLYTAAERRLRSLETDAAGVDLLDAVSREERLTREFWQKVIELGSRGDKEEALTLLTDSVRMSQRGWLDNLSAAVAFQEESAVASARQARQEYDRTRRIVLIGDVLVLLVSGVLVFFLASGIVRPLRDFTRTVDSIAGGDLTTRISLVRRDEIGTLGLHINRMVEQLQATEKELDQYRFHLEELIEERTGAMNEQRKRFTSMLIHDLKGPVVPIIGFSRKLATGKEIGREKTLEYAEAICTAAMKLASTIDRVSAELRGNNLQHSFNVENFDIGQLLASVVASYMPKAELEGIRLIVQCGGEGEGDRLVYTGDSARFQTLFENLIGNAMKYARTAVEIQLARKGGAMILTVDDDGPGIENKYREMIFEEYFQTPDSKDGSGVGLYSARNIVEHYRGVIRVGESPRGGARFTVELPAVVR